MKNLFLTILALVCINAPSALAVEVKAHAKGIVCSFCAQGIQKKLGARAEVENVNVNLDDGTVTVKLKEGRNLTNEEIQKVLEDSGYDVSKIERK